MAKKKRKHWATYTSFQHFVWRLPQVLAGKLRVSTTPERRVYNAFWSAVIQTLFIEIHDAYEVKSYGLPDANGDQWEDLAPEYKAYKREKKGYLTANQRKKYKLDTPGLLSITQYRRWRKTFAKIYQREIRKSRRGDGLTDVEAKAKAASIAWNEAKKKGAETLIKTLGNKPYPIMIFTGQLFNSFRPGKISNLRYVKGDKNQVVKLKRGELEIGTKVKYAHFASRQLTRSLSKNKEISYNYEREFLPDNLGIFYERAMTKGRDAAAEELQKLAQENARR